MRIGELAKRSGLSVDTIRYYERIGLLPRAARDGANRRDYDREVMAWVAFLRRLKTTGMPLREMQRYAALRAAGAGTEAERRALLVRHRASVRQRLTELQDCLSALDDKIAGYGDANAGATDDDASSDDHDGRRAAGARAAEARGDRR
jgi:DNA-binding transcriptional MerR regulator